MRDLNLVVLRDGEAIVELGDRELRDTYSVTKSVVSTLVGIALARGDVRTIDPWRSLLTMTAGLRSDIDEVMELGTSWRAAIDARPRQDAGAFSYDNGTAHVLACELADAVGRPLDEYAADVLFRPLGIDAWHWPRDPEGYALGFGHLRLRTLDLAQLGETWRAGALVDAGYRTEATRAQTPGGPPEHRAYGYCWWIGTRGFFGAGYGGQLLWVAGNRVVASNAGEGYPC